MYWITGPVEEFFSYRSDGLWCENVRVSDLADEEGTPLYVYSRSALEWRFDRIRDAFSDLEPLICYSIKANGNLSVLRLLAERGSGFDIVSGGELFRALKAGASPEKIVYAGVGKSAAEIRQALEAGIYQFNVESPSELRAIDRVAGEMGVRARTALRLNPDVDARTHAKTTTGKKETKFGIPLDEGLGIFEGREAFPNVDVNGIHLHLGSPIYTVEPYREALDKMADFIPRVRKTGAAVETLNVGGGYCISYDGRDVLTPAEYAEVIVPAVRELGCRLILEPGRYIVGNAALLVTRVTYLKEGWAGRRFVICDAAMNDLLRPALYDAYHHIWPLKGPGSPVFFGGGGNNLQEVDVVGPICESSDVFARDRKLPSLEEGDLLAVFSAGAYGLSMSSNYNGRPRPAEVLVEGRGYRTIRTRETYEDLIRGEL
jgi:diaminopimelate decarboxylase